jgi:2Fe-2S ferredoxin
VATINFLKNKKPITVPMGVNLMKALLENGISVASSCSGDAVCAKCWVYVLNGKENLSAIRSEEAHLIEIKNLPSQCRLTCQVEVLGDITIDTPYW